MGGQVGAPFALESSIRVPKRHYQILAFRSSGPQVGEMPPSAQGSWGQGWFR